MKHLDGNIFIKEDGGSSSSSSSTSNAVGSTIGSPTPYQGSGVGIKKPQGMKPAKKKKKKYRANKSIDSSTFLKDMVVEGDFVIVACEDETHVGIVQYVMTEGVLGIASSDYAIEASMENPAILIRTLELEEDEGIWEESEYLVGAESKMVTKIEPLALEVEVSSEVAMAMYDSSIGKAYEGCGCPMCKELNVTCEQCPQCQAGEMKSDCCGNVNKQAPCWDGYVQRGMKPGADGKPVPNCVPAAKADDLFADSPFRVVK
jgi:hypothetical protein